MSEHEGHDRVSGHIERVPPTQKPRVNARCQEFVVEGGRGIKAQLLVSRLRALKLAPDTLKRGVAQDGLVGRRSGNQDQRPEEHHGEVLIMNPTGTITTAVAASSPSISFA